MNALVIQHLQRNWPLTVVAIGLAIFIPVVLATGVFPTNQGKIRRSVDPAGYWRWTGAFVALLATAIAVLADSYLLLPA